MYTHIHISLLIVILLQYVAYVRTDQGVRSVLAISMLRNFKSRVSIPMSKYVELCVQPWYIQHLLRKGMHARIKKMV